VTLPVPGVDPEHPVGALVLGVNPRRALDDDYIGFFQLVAGQFATAISNAQSYEKERQRAEALAELDQAKTTFFSNVSHEFRTPLTLMLGPLEELLGRNGPDAPEQAGGELQVIHRNGLRLLKLVNTLLDFSRIEAGRIQANYEPTDLCALTRDLASTFRSTMEKAGLGFAVECSSFSEPVFVDRDLWEKIVFNLLSNAFKFTLEGGVSVQLSGDQGCAVLRVCDTGTGIPPEEIGNIFKRFHRIQNARARTHEGTGIGLALVHELVKLHGGSIAVESKPQEGTMFVVRIPFGSAHLPADRISAARRQPSTALRVEAFVEEASRWTPSDLPKTTPTRPELATGRPARVLVADDNADMREYIARLLAGRHEVETVADGAKALAAARRQKPDVIVSDVMMPGMDGLELLRAVREDASLGSVPVILLSARAGEEAVAEGVEHGADDYLVKPFTGRELIARLEAHLRLARIRQEALAKETRLREAAESAQQRLEAVLSGIDEQFLLLDHDWRFVYVNDRTLQASGFSRKELLGRTLWEMFPAAASGRFHDEVVKAVAEGKPARFEYYYQPWDKWLDNRVYPTAEGILILAADITRGKEMEAALQRNEERFRLAAFSEAITMYEQDAELRYTWLYPLHPEHRHALGKSDLELQPNEQGRLLMEWKREVMATGEPQRRETRTSLAVGARVYDVFILPRRNAAGEIIGVAGTALDITQRKQIEEQLQERTRSLELINRVGATVAGELDLEKLVQTVTDAGREISGAEFGAFFYNVKNAGGESYTLYTLSGAPREAFAKFPMPRNTQVFAPTFNGEGVVRVADILQDPRYGKNAPYHGMPKGHLPVRSYLAAPVVSRSGEVLGGLFYGHSAPGVFTEEAERIVTAIAAQAAIAIDNAQLYRAAQRLAAIVESSDDVIISKDLNGIIASWNKGAERIFGYTADEVIGKPVTILMPPDRLNEEPGILDRVRRGERIDHYETVRRRKDGALIHISLAVSPIRDSKGNVIGASKVARDITERVRAKEELEKTVAERTASLREAIAQMEEFSYSVSHDLRAPVRAMQGYAHAVLEDYGDRLDETVRDYLGRIMQSGSRMDRLIQDVLTYSRVSRTEMKLQPVDLDQLVRSILQQYPEFESSRAKITIARKLPSVLGHEPSLTQVISNLLSNAVKFVSPGTKPEVLIRSEVHGAQIRLWVEDNGIGIKPQYQSRLFGMFERIHPEERYEGTGIGLAIVRKATERMDGKVGVESDGIHGSRFWIQLAAA